MGSITTCDGSGVEISPESPKTGHFDRVYSEEMRPIAENYLCKVDDLHTRMATQFTDELALIRATYREKLKFLPDEP